MATHRFLMGKSFISMSNQHKSLEIRPPEPPALISFYFFLDSSQSIHKVYQRLFCLPSSAQLEDADIRHIVASVLAQVKKQSASA